jgi:hypothetical protein
MTAFVRYLPLPPGERVGERAGASRGNAAALSLPTLCVGPLPLPGGERA